MIRQLALAALMLLAQSQAFTTISRTNAFTTRQRSPMVLRDAAEGVADAAVVDAASSLVDSAWVQQTAAVVQQAAAPINYDDGIPPLANIVPDMTTIALVAGQENYGLAVVCIGEALWSFFQAPSVDHAKILIPAIVAALLLVAGSGPLITSGDPASVSTGLFIATGVSVGLGLSYVARMAAPFSPSSKEIAALGLLVAVAGFFSFSQNLVVDGFVTLPSIPLPSLPEINLPF